MTRRTFLGAAGAATAATALPNVPGFSGLLPQAAAADTQTNLSRMVDMRFGMFNHFSLGTFTNEEYLPKQWNRTDSTDGDITSYTISTSTDGTNFTQVATGT